MSPLTSRRSVRPGLDNHFLLGGLSSGSCLLCEGRTGRHHIGGQDVELTFYHRRGYRIVFRTQFLTFRCALNSVVCIRTFYVKPVL